MTTRWGLTAGLLLALASPARAEVYKMNDGFRNGSVTITRQSDGNVAVRIEFAQRGCFGDIGATGRQQGSTIVAQASTGIPNAPPCTVRLNVKGNTVDVTEQNCMFFHGASCEAGGTYKLAR
jgi:hypothetical protein